ncbi:MAG: Flavin reductase, partial [Myxococcaceae bacterium]|nr:Flavin reductase [Myxococcaceae bacterium]
MSPLRLLVLGATGGIGRAIVDESLARGSHVTALVRSPAKVARKHERLHVIEGSPLDASAVVRALDGADAVISTLGHTDLGRSTIVADAARVLVSSMATTRVRRVALVSTTLVVPGGGALANLPRWITRHALADSIATEALVTATDLDWTIVRLV